jgi:DNA polymerase-3 subunit alpha
MVNAGALPEEMENTLTLAARVNLELEVNTDTHRVVHMPDFPVPPGVAEDGQTYERNEDTYLADLCLESLRRYLDENPSFDERAYRKRLAYELDVISGAGFSGYFLIVWDYIHWVRQNGGLTGPGRGSAAASLVTFLLGITLRIDPLQYPDLMFERFLTPGRPDLPDIDTDFDFASAEAVLHYCEERYGKEKVSKIGTFSQMGVRQSLQDVGRVLNIPFLDVQKAANLFKDFRPDEEMVVDDNKAMFSLDDVAKFNPELATLRDSDSDHLAWFMYANQLQGTRRNASQHASGVAIAQKALVDLGVPLMQSKAQGKNPVVTTQFDMDDLAKLGIPKFDQLKLSNLNIIAETEALVGDDFSIDDIPLDDVATFTALSRGDNLGIFQVAQSKVRGVLRAVRPQTLSDIAAVITIIRPGLLARDSESGLTQEELYKARRQGSLPIRYRFPFLRPILQTTQGVMIYQEQVLKVCWAAGMTPLEADKLRKVLSKKQMSKAKVFQTQFLAGAQKNLSLTQADAQELWDLIVEFAAYGFNAAHAYAYGLIAYWTSYLKTHYPAEFMTATLSVLARRNNKASKLLVPKLLEDCSQMGRRLEILPPNVNKSSDSFVIEKHETPQGLTSAIRFGLAGIRNVGALAEHILAERAKHGLFTDFWDFDSRLTTAMGRRPSRTALDALALAGAFDDFFSHRSEALHEIRIAREDTKKKREELKNLGWVAEKAAKLAQSQAELCGNFYFVKNNVEVLGRECDNFFEANKNDRITVGGRVIECKLDRRSKNGNGYHSITLKTQWGDIKIDFFASRTVDQSAYLQGIKEKLFNGAVIFVTGTVRGERDMYGNSITLPKAEYRGELSEDPTLLKKQAAAILLETAS